jgi:hypothetical protein
LLVALFRELAVLQQLGRLGDIGPQLLGRDGEPRLERVGEQHALTHDVFEDGGALFRCVEKRRIDAAARHLAQLILPVPQRLAVLLLRYLVIADRCDALRPALPSEIRVDAEKRERRDDQHEEADHDPLLVFGDDVEHLEVP